MSRRMIENYLQNYFHVGTGGASLLTGFDVSRAPHLDEDALCAFTEGRLTQIESAPFITHVVACEMCLHNVATLLRLQSEIGFGENIMRDTETSDEPGRIRQLFNQLASRLAPFTDDQTVFAYQEKDEEDKDGTDSENDTVQ